MPAIFVGRFQPFHKGHLKAIKWILKREKEIFIIIGSSQESLTKNNPLSFLDRKKMIKETLLAEGIKKFKIYGVADFPNDIFWVKEILRKTKLKPEEVVVFTKNPWTKRCFEKMGMKVKPHPLFFRGLSATKIREKILKHKNWKNLVPKTVWLFLNRRANKIFPCISSNT
jgi:nicotinamide-nucleotide adenylyltransferase